ncbi:MAG TPA: hypothetical protein VIM33_05955 [Gaiellaceae bacterium]
MGGVFVLGMHRSGTSAVTRLISFLGFSTPEGQDLVPPSDKNPKGYWESMSLVALNERVLGAVGSDMGCPLPFTTGWEKDPRLDGMREPSLRSFQAAFPKEPWVWKDPRNCLTLAFWRSVLTVLPAVVLVHRNPLEIAASSLRLRHEEGKIYVLALWERYLRLALRELEDVPVLITSYGELLAQPIAWCEQTGLFLAQTGLPVHKHREEDVLSFVDRDLRHGEFSRADFLDDEDVSENQKELFLALERMEGDHQRFSPPVLAAETPTTEALLAERRRTLQVKHELSGMLEVERESRRWSRVRTSPYVAPARRVYANVRRLRRDKP